MKIDIPYAEIEQRKIKAFVFIYYSIITNRNFFHAIIFSLWNLFMY